MPDSKCWARSQQVLDLARRKAGGADPRRVEREHRRGCSTCAAPAVRATKRSQIVCAALVEICWPTIARARVVKASPRLSRRPSAKRAISFFITRSRRERWRQASSQKSALVPAGWRTAVVASAKAQALTQVVPAAESLRTIPSSARLFLIASARGVVAGALGGAPLLDAADDRRLVDGASGLQEGARRLLQDAEDRAEGLEQPRILRAGGPVDLGRKLEQQRDRDRRVEVVVHRLAEGGGTRLAPVGFAHLAGRDLIERGVEAAQRCPGVVEVLVAEIHRAAVVGAQGEEADRLAVVALEHLADGEEVAERLRHLLVVDVEQAVVHPDVGEGARRSPPRSGRSRSRGAGTAGPGRRHGCRSARRAAPCTWPSTRCASPAGRGRTRSATWRRRARSPSPPSTSRSRADPPCRRAPPRARRREAGRSTCRRACRSRRTCAPR